MADRNNINEFVKLFEKKLYEKLPFSIFQHEEDDEQEYVMLKVTSTYKGTMYRYRHIMDYVEINNFYDIMHGLENLVDYVVELLYREFLDKFEEIQIKEEQAMNFYEFNKKLTKTFGDFYILAKDKKPCAVCGNLTNRVDIHYEQRVCSNRCRSILDTGLAKRESEGEVI